MRLLEPISAAIGRRHVKSKQFTSLLQNLPQLWKRNLKAEHDKNHDNITGFKPSEGRSKAVFVFKTIYFVLFGVIFIYLHGVTFGTSLSFLLYYSNTEPKISQKHFITVNKDSNKNYNVYCHFKTTTILALLENIHLIMFFFFFNWSLLWFYIYLSNKKIKKTFIFIWFKVFVFICPSQGEGVLEQTDAGFPLYETPVRWLDWQPQLITATDSF